MPTLNMKATPNTVWALLQEVGRKQEETAIQMKETDRKLQESKVEPDRMIAETDRKFPESKAEHDRMIAETDQQIQNLGDKIDKLSTNLGGVGNDLGEIAEGMLTSDLLDRFHAFGLDFDDALRNIEIRERGTKRLLAEIDCLLLNTDIALVAEVKASMTKGDVDKHLTRMRILSGKQNGLLSGKDLYGAIAGIKIRAKTREYAKSKGLFVLEPSGDTVMIESPAGKPAMW
jgi:hypothetical protein